MLATTRMYATFFILLGLSTLVTAQAPAREKTEPGSSGPRYPSGISLASPEGYLFTSNKAAGSASMIGLDSGKVLHELELGRGARPSQVHAFHHGEHLRIAVSDEANGVVCILRVVDPLRPRLELLLKLDAPGSPEGLQYSPTTKNLIVACGLSNRVLIFDPVKPAPLFAIPTVEGPRRLQLLSEGQGYLLVVSGRDSIGLVDLSKNTMVGKTAIALGRALNIQGIASSRGNIFLSHQVQPTEVAVDPQMIVWGLIIANRITSVPVSTLTVAPPSKKATEPPEEKYIYGVGYQGGDPRHRIVPLDQRQRAIGDPGKPALVPLSGSPGDLILLPSGGTNRLLFIDTEQAYLPGTEPLSRQEALPSINVGSRPISVVCTPQSDRAFVLCSLDDSIWEIDIQKRKVLRILRLGPQPEDTIVHLGAKIFFNSKRSRGGWYSCNSCHPDGGTRGHNFDTHADGDGLAKKAPDLHGSVQTPPWAWNGKFKTIKAQVSASLHSTMSVNQEATPEDVERVMAFLGTLKTRPSNHPRKELGGDPAKGAALFEKAACATCHEPPLYTVPDLRDVGVFDEYDGYRKFNPPSLLGLSRRGRYLHDGRAKTLLEIFTLHDKEKKHGKAHLLSPPQLADLVAFLRTL